MALMCEASRVRVSRNAGMLQMPVAQQEPVPDQDRSRERRNVGSVGRTDTLG